MTRMLLVLALASACSTAASTPVQMPSNTATADLAGRRAQLIGWLHDYRVAGVYPTDAVGEPASVFVDDKGVRCPMAEMIHKSGRDDLVDAVKREGNTVRLADVHAGPLFDWMLASGLTQEEVALVQGAMTFEYGFNGNEVQFVATPQLATAEVRGRLEMAEAALRTATGASLAIAAARLPKQLPSALAGAPITGRVVPPGSVPAPAPVVARAMTPMRRVR